MLFFFSTSSRLTTYQLYFKIEIRVIISPLRMIGATEEEGLGACALGW